mmetsp:Transcript_2264/g.4154  ORF Transcript_2264/g.4154 Transcript_2264/m.4154 type:complete len:251 (-) Transcript_2264:679-1431(-)
MACPTTPRWVVCGCGCGSACACGATPISGCRKLEAGGPCGFFGACSGAWCAPGIALAPVGAAVGISAVAFGFGAPPPAGGGAPKPKATALMPTAAPTGARAMPGAHQAPLQAPKKPQGPPASSLRQPLMGVAPQAQALPQPQPHTTQRGVVGHAMGGAGMMQQGQRQLYPPAASSATAQRLAVLKPSPYGAGRPGQQQLKQQAQQAQQPPTFQPPLGVATAPPQPHLKAQQQLSQAQKTHHPQQQRHSHS